METLPLMKSQVTRHYSSRRQTGGFTLIEVTIAISILAVMVSLNYRILNGVVKVKELLDDRREGMFIANSVLTRMSRELQLITGKYRLLPGCDTANDAQSNSNQTSDLNQPPDPNQPGGAGSGRRPVFVGQSGVSGNSITFNAREGGQYIPDGGTHSGVVQITYRVAQDPDQKGTDGPALALIRDETPNTKPLTKACKNVLHFPITSNLLSLQFQYYDGRTKEWTDSWDGERISRLPKIIQFTVSLKSPAGKIQTYTSSVFVSAAL